MQKLYCSILKSQRKIKQDFFIAHSTSRGKKNRKQTKYHTSELKLKRLPTCKSREKHEMGLDFNI